MFLSFIEENISSADKIVDGIWHSEDGASWYILLVKPTRHTTFSNLFLE